MKLRNLTMTALFIALSFAGGYIKIMGSIAFDAFPAFLGALLLGPFCGALIGGLGHIFSAMIAGFPSTPVIHVVIAVTMALTMIGYSYTYRFMEKRCKNQMINYIVTGVVGIVLNGPVSLLLTSFLLIPIMGKAGIIALLPVLTVAAAANVFMSVLVHAAVRNVWSKYYERA